MTSFSDIKTKITSGIASLKTFYNEASTAIRVFLAALGTILLFLFGAISLKFATVMIEGVVFLIFVYGAYHLLGLYQKGKKTAPIDKI